MSQGNGKLVQDLETVEMEAIRDFYVSAADASIRRCGLGIAATGGSVVALASRADVLALNRVIGLGLKRPVAGEDLERIVELYRARRVPRFFVQASPVAEGRLGKLLPGFGFSPYNRWVKLYRDAATAPVVDTDLEVRRIGSDEAAIFGDIVASCFDWPAGAGAWVAGLVGRPGWRHYMAYAGAKPVATGALYLGTAGSAWIDFAATLPGYRGRGAQKALLAHRIRDANELGCRRTVVETAEETEVRSSPSFRNTLAFGFRVAYVRPNFILRPSSEAL